MNTKRFVLAAIAAFVFIFAFEFLWHGVLLQGFYQNTKSVWRPEADMGKFFYWVLLSNAAISAVIAYLFTRNYEAKGLAEGLRFGVMIGLLLGIMQFGIYPYLPIPLTLAGLWFAGGFLEGLGVGIVLAAVYRADGSGTA